VVHRISPSQHRQTVSSGLTGFTPIEGTLSGKWVAAVMRLAFAIYEYAPLSGVAEVDRVLD
jgi:hypothetical protein